MEQFRNLLIQAFNEAELPFDAKYYIIKDVFRDVSSMYDNMLKEQSAMANTAANTEDPPVEIEEVE